MANTSVQRIKARFINIETGDAEASTRQFDRQGQAHVTQANDRHQGAALFNTPQEFGNCALHHFCSIVPLVAMGVHIADILPPTSMPCLEEHLSSSFPVAG